MCVLVGRKEFEIYSPFGDKLYQDKELHLSLSVAGVISLRFLISPDNAEKVPSLRTGKKMATDCAMVQNGGLSEVDKECRKKES